MYIQIRKKTSQHNYYRDIRIHSNNAKLKTPQALPTNATHFKKARTTQKYQPSCKNPISKLPSKVGLRFTSEVSLCYILHTQWSIHLNLLCKQHARLLLDFFSEWKKSQIYFTAFVKRRRRTAKINVGYRAPDWRERFSAPAMLTGSPTQLPNTS